jgi:hypothetical protein
LKSWIVIPYALASFVSASLLFSAEPMIGKLALPPLGGTPAVWNTCLLFFQASLLAGYLLAMAAGRLDDFSRWTVLVALGLLLALGYLVQPIALGFGDASREHPAISLLPGSSRRRRYRWG